VLNAAEFRQFRSFIFCEVCSDTSKVWWEIWHGFCFKFLEGYNSERILKINQHLSKRMYSGTVFRLTVYSVSQKSSPPPLKRFAIVSLRLSMLPWNFASLLPVYIHTCLPILVDLR